MRLPIQSVLVCACTLLLPLSGAADCGLDQMFVPSAAASYQANVSRDFVGNAVDQAQTFTVLETGTLTDVDLLLSGFNQQAALLVDIRPTVAGVPVADDALALGRAVIAGSALTSSFQWINAAFDGQDIPVQAGDVLAIVLRVDPASATGGDFGWRGDTGDPHPSGTAYFRAPTDWLAPMSSGMTVDYGFRAYVAPEVPAPGTVFSNDSGTGTLSFDYHVSGTYTLSESFLGTSDTQTYEISGTATASTLEIAGDGDVDVAARRLSIEPGLHIYAELVNPPLTDTMHFELLGGAVQVSITISIVLETLRVSVLEASVHELGTVSPGAVPIVSGDPLAAHVLATNTATATILVTGSPPDTDTVQATEGQRLCELILEGALTFDEDLRATRAAVDVATVLTETISQSETGEGITLETTDTAVISNLHVEMDVAARSPATVPLPVWVHAAIALFIAATALRRRG